jgi:hypothetical protein
MTNKEIKTLTAFYNTRIESLDFAIDTINSSFDCGCTELMIMRREYQFKLDTLIENKLKINA